MSAPDLPNFILCGAAKSGTTTLHAMLDAHPDVFMATPKEPHFFVRDDVVGRVPELVADLDAYRALYAGGTGVRWRGEASVFYLYYFERAIDEILRVVGPDMRIAIVLRNPIDRAYSAWLHASKYNPDENLNFEAALDAEPGRRAQGRCSPMLFYQDCGLYSRSAGAYMAAFDRCNVFLFDDLENDSAKFIEAMLDFLELPFAAEVPMRERRNTGGRVWAATGIGQTVKALALPAIRRAGKRLAPAAYERMKAGLTRRLMAPVEPMRPETHARLAAFFENDIAALGSLLGRDLSSWLVPDGAT